MVKRILLALGTGSEAGAAVRFAVDLARCHDAELAALAVVEVPRPRLASAQPAAMTAGSGEEVTTLQAFDTLQETMDGFNTAVSVAGIKHRSSIEEGIAADRILEDLRFFDLLVVNRRPRFAFNRLEGALDTLARIVKRAVAPVVVLNGSVKPIERVLVALDGSAPSIRTLQRFGQFKLFRQTQSITVMNVRQSHSADEQRASELLLQRAAGYLRAHSYATVRSLSLVNQNVAGEILGQVECQKSGMVVAGAHSVSALKRLAFGSTTHALIERCEQPMFLYH